MKFIDEIKEQIKLDPKLQIAQYLGDDSFIISKLCEKIDELQEEIKDIKYRYVMRTDLEE